MENITRRSKKWFCSYWMSEDEWMDVHHYFHASKSEDEKEKRMMTFKGSNVISSILLK
jgi:hypothetical protein